MSTDASSTGPPGPTHPGPTHPGPTHPGPTHLDGPGESHRRVREAFDQDAVAGGYSSEFRSRRDQRARRTIERILDALPRGAAVLDLPCGTGRLLPVLAERGFRITQADSSAKMVELARQTWDRVRNELGLTAGDPRFAVADIMSTSFVDDEFDAVIANRLFHHFAEASTRTSALRELGRIATGPVIVFFFDAGSFGGLRARLGRRLKRRRRGSHVLYTRREFAANARAAGLRVERFIATRFGGKECFAVCRRDA